MSRAPLTIVLPWYGPDTAGGAEWHARQLVAALHRAAVPVEVWATTARDARSPVAPHYALGWDVLDDVPVRRFAATQGSLPAWVRRTPQRWGLDAAPPNEWQLLAALTGSDTLLEALAHEAHGKRRFIFFLYAYPTTFFGAQIVGARAMLIPCLHDEPYAHYSTTRQLLESVPLILANSYGEAALIRALSGIGPERCPVVGEGIDLTWRGDGAAFRRRHGLDGPLLLFVGRRDYTKNFPVLWAYLEQRWRERGPQPQLMLAGAGEWFIPPALRPWVHDLGYISEADKHAAFAAADVHCNPSLLESFSLALMEGWLQGTPALVHARCAVTVDHCQRAEGGLWFDSYAQFNEALDQLLDPQHGPAMGAHGRAWVQANCRWEDVVVRILAAMERPRSG